MTRCTSCGKVIPDDETPVRVNDMLYHKECAEDLLLLFKEDRRMENVDSESGYYSPEDAQYVCPKCGKTIDGSQEAQMSFWKGRRICPDCDAEQTRGQAETIGGPTIKPIRASIGAGKEEPKISKGYFDGIMDAMGPNVVIETYNRHQREQDMDMDYERAFADHIKANPYAYELYRKDRYGYYVLETETADSEPDPEPEKRSSLAPRTYNQKPKPRNRNVGKDGAWARPSMSGRSKEDEGESQEKRKLSLRLPTFSFLKKADKKNGEGTDCPEEQDSCEEDGGQEDKPEKKSRFKLKKKEKQGREFDPDSLGERFRRFKLIHFGNHVVLKTLTRDDNAEEYHLESTLIPRSELPEDAVKVTGQNFTYCLDKIKRSQWYAESRAEFRMGQDDKQVQFTASDAALYMRTNKIDNALAVKWNSVFDEAGLSSRTMIIIGVAILAIVIVIVLRVVSS